MLKTNVTDCFGKRLKDLLISCDCAEANEIRIRIGKPVILRYSGRESFITEDGSLTENIDEAVRANSADISDMVNMLSSYSLYAFQEQIKQGFITVPGGHRAALAGTAVTENEKITALKNISSVSLRIASERIGCAEEALRYIKEPQNTLIVSPVCGGKTTMLRDLLRLLSNLGYTVGISDERGEIAACYMGVPQLDMGERTDVLDSCPKALGMSMLVRTMSPDIVAADEIGTEDDIKAIREASLSGSAVVCTAHGADYDDIKKRLGENINIFNVIIFLEGRKNPGKIKSVVNSKGESLCL